MGEGKPSSTPSTTSSTPETMENHTGNATSTHGANTNLDPSMQGGAGTAADAAATENVVEQHQQGLPTGIAGQSDPAKQMDNSGMLNPTGEGSDADQMGASGVDRNSDT
ncbi:hypothetical protein [Deinococcus sp. QL22]|uniref:hypothetical protein n=1 Tax=Deinococcus sp. QL22 TaxID=2939437 RepID=UPI0020178787|nr:hypothetical protein [Deinococcus sp. QL22]UQN07312.1 hypothetical protein M1R55_05270 [Deinococcus sp. QL22]